MYLDVKDDFNYYVETRAGDGARVLEGDQLGRYCNNPCVVLLRPVLRVWRKSRILDIL